MSQPRADLYKKRLLQLKAEILDEGDTELDPAEDRSSGLIKPDEDAQPLAEMNQVIASSRNRNRTEVLGRVIAALARLDKDLEGGEPTFGQCLECGEAISPRRLELMPYVELCVECQQSRDTPSGPTGRRHLRDYR
jgi:DnaK suppressor protein